MTAQVLFFDVFSEKTCILMSLSTFTGACQGNICIVHIAMNEGEI